MSKVLLLVIGISCLSLNVYGQRKVKIKYKERQTIDLGALNIDGEIVTPGDFTVEDEKQKASELIFKRVNHKDRLKINIDYVL